MCADMLRLLIVVTHGSGMEVQQGKIAACDRPDTVINRGRARFQEPQTQTLTPVIGLAQSLHSRSQTGFGGAVTGRRLRAFI